MKNHLHYCKKCGRIVLAGDIFGEPICDKCDSVIYPIPDEFFKEGYSDCWKSDQLKQEFIERYIKSSPEFDQYYFDHREEISRQKHGDHLDICFTDGGKTAYVRGSKQDPEVNTVLNIKCSYCGSSNVKKISVTAKAVNTGLFGIFGTKRYKQWHCNSCGSDF